MQAEAERWSAEVAGRRACRPLAGAAPAAVFEARRRMRWHRCPPGRSCGHLGDSEDRP
jgi:hypothetical protein